MTADQPTLFDALLAFQEQAPTLQKDAVNPHFGNRYVSLDALTQVVTPLLCAQKLVWTAMPCSDEGHPALRYRLVHVPSGESIEGVMPLMLSKDDSQGLGSALTYARRYAISAVLGLSAEDDDGNAASRRQSNGAAKAANGSPKLASVDEVKEMAAAAKGLDPVQIRLALAACGVEGVERFGQVPADKALALTKALAGIERAS